MRDTMKHTIVAAALAAMTICTPVAAFINPNFTPVHLVRQSEAIVLVEFQKVGADGQAKAVVVEVLKGKMDAKDLAFDFQAGAFEAKGDQITAQVAGPHKRALMFIGAFQRSEDEEGMDEADEGAKALLHVGKDWVTLSWWDETSTWDMDDIDAVLLGTWAGSDVMLRRAVKYLLTDEQADVPIASNASWAGKIPAGTVAGKVFDVRPVDLLDDGKIVLHVASAKADRLLRWDAAAGKPVEITAKHKLAARSHAAAWGDMNRDGRIDLVSFDGKQIMLHARRADATFAATSMVDAATVKGGCRSLSVVDCGERGVGVVIGGREQPLLAVIGPKGKVSVAPLHAGAAPAEAAKMDLNAGRCLIADLDNDLTPDVLAVGARGSLLYRGKPKGEFAAPSAVAVGQGAGRAAAFVGDYDMDGLPGVLTVAEDGNRIYHNLGEGKFEEMLAMSGEIEYIAKRGGIGGMTGDVNNDGRQDVLIVYSSMSPQVFFNRGFHSFGHARALDLDMAHLLDSAQEGQQAGCLADVNGDGALDMFLVLADGRMWLFPRTIDAAHESGSAAAVVRLPVKAGRAGPVTVTGWVENRCLGSYVLTAGGPPALFGVTEPAPVTVKWRWGGGKMQTAEVFVEDGPVPIEVTAK